MKRAGSGMAQSTLDAVGEALAAQRQARYVLRLYAIGMTLRSTEAIANIRKICAEHLWGRHELQIVDLYQHPLSAEGEAILAAPTLIRKQPLPSRRFIGDMRNTGKILAGLDLRAASAR